MSDAHRLPPLDRAADGPRLRLHGRTAGKDRIDGVRKITLLDALPFAIVVEATLISKSKIRVEGEEVRRAPRAESFRRALVGVSQVREVVALLARAYDHVRVRVLGVVRLVVRVDGHDRDATRSGS